MTKPRKPRNKPFVVDVEQGEEYYWCDCGLTLNPPWCDGSHKGTPNEPVVFIAKETKPVHICGCSKSSTKPYCDGAHKKK